MCAHSQPPAGFTWTVCLNVPLVLFGRSVTYYSVTKGPKFSVEIEEATTDITKAMLAEYGRLTAGLRLCFPSVVCADPAPAAFPVQWELEGSQVQTL